MIPFNTLKESKKHENLKPGDICLLKFEGKVRAEYRLCRIVEVIPGDDGLVRTVKIAIRPRKKAEPRDRCKGGLNYFDVGVKRLVLIVPAK